MKQTAVEWLIGQLYAPCRGIPSHIIEQAKDIEKHQILNTYIEASPKLGDILKEASERYYNETFNING
jgi:hypothetical protein